MEDGRAKWGECAERVAGGPVGGHGTIGWAAVRRMDASVGIGCGRQVKECQGERQSVQGYWWVCLQHIKPHCFHSAEVEGESVVNWPQLPPESDPADWLQFPDQESQNPSYLVLA